MTVKDISKIIYNEGTVSEDNNIIVISMVTGEVFWNGKAKELQNQEAIQHFHVNEILVDKNDMIRNPKIPFYKLGKIIMVY